MQIPHLSHFFAPIAVLAIVLTVFGSSVLFDSEIKKDAYAQGGSEEAQDEMPATLQQDRIDLSEVKNLTMTEISILREISSDSTKLATQSAYTAMSVFFLGISLVIFGLRLTGKGISQMGKYFTLMIWALTIPVVLLVAIYQYGVMADNPTFLAESDEPFYLLSFLMYVPIGIVLFLLLEQKRIIRHKAARESEQTENDIILRLEKISTLREKGMITEDEFEKLKSESFSQFTRDAELQRRFVGSLTGSKQNV